MSFLENEVFLNQKTVDRDDFIYMELGHALPSFGRNIFTTIEGIQKLRNDYQNTGLYRSAFLYDNINIENSSLFSSLYFDFDSEEDVELAREDLLFVIWKLHLKSGFGLPLEAFRIYYSGMKGFHLVIPWQYFDLMPHPKLDKIFRWIAEDLRSETLNQTLDMVVYERRRLWRLENSIHQKTALHKIPLQYEEAATMSLENIQKMAEQNRLIRYQTPYVVLSAKERMNKYVKEFEDFMKKKEEERKNRKPGKASYAGSVPDFVQDLIDQGPVKGLRNETAAALTSFWRFNQELSEEEVWNNLLAWNNDSLKEQELQTTMDSILKRGLTYSMSRLRSLSEGEIATDFFTRDKYKK